MDSCDFASSHISPGFKGSCNLRAPARIAKQLGHSGSTWSFHLDSVLQCVNCLEFVEGEQLHAQVPSGDARPLWLP